MMTVKKVEKIVNDELKRILLYFIKRDKYGYEYLDGKMDMQLYYDVKSIGGDAILLLSLAVKINHIEDKWTMYLNELGLQENLFRDSFYFTYNHVDCSKFPSIVPGGLSVELDENWIRNTVREIVVDYYLPFSERLKDIKYCDQIINKDIEITDETCKLSFIDGLPFRKIFIAEEAGNPRLEEIKTAMRAYCNNLYNVGKEKNLEKLYRIKPVFEKLFGS